MHRKYAAVFDNDLTTGYNHKMGRYEASCVFQSTSSPQYNRSCQELLQAKCDQLERQGILVDPMSVSKFKTQKVTGMLTGRSAIYILS